MTEAGEPDKYYKQPGHPLSEMADKGGRFKVRSACSRAPRQRPPLTLRSVSPTPLQRPKGYTSFDPNNPQYVSDLEKVDRTNEAREQ